MCSKSKTSHLSRWVEAEENSPWCSYRSFLDWFLVSILFWFRVCSAWGLVPGSVPLPPPCMSCEAHHLLFYSTSFSSSSCRCSLYSCIHDITEILPCWILGVLPWQHDAAEVRCHFDVVSVIFWSRFTGCCLWEISLFCEVTTLSFVLWNVITVWPAGTPSHQLRTHCDAGSLCVLLSVICIHLISSFITSQMSNPCCVHWLQENRTLLKNWTLERDVCSNNDPIRW